MKKLAAFRNKISGKSLHNRIILLCKIFMIGLLLQFFLQTFVTFKLGRDGKFWTLFWMWKEFILLIFVVVLLRYMFSNLKTRINTIKNKENSDKISRKLLWENVKSKFIFQFFAIFFATLVIFFILALLIQHVGLTAFVLSIKYDLIGFFIFGIGVCLALAFFTEEDKTILELYRKLISRALRLGLIRWFIVWLMPNIFKYFGFNPNIYEGTVGQNPPAAYYTNITPRTNNSYVRNTFVFERPTSFGFWLIAFFPIFVLGYLRKKNWKNQILPVIAFGLLILSTRSRAGIAVWILEAIILFFILYWKSVKKYFVRLCLLFIIGLCGIGYLGKGIMVREHSNTGHLILLESGRNLAKGSLLQGRGAGYAGPASHQLCYTEEHVDIYANPESLNLDNERCEILRKENIKNQISTYGFNPENQYLQILIEYGLVGTIFWLALCVIILCYTWKMILSYQKKTKSPYQELLYFCLLGFGIGFIGLCAEGLVLHSLADRMIVYPFFLLYGITLGLREKEKDKTYLVETKKKKKHKKKIA